MLAIEYGLADILWRVDQREFLREFGTAAFDRFRESLAFFPGFAERGTPISTSLECQVNELGDSIEDAPRHHN